MSPEEVVRKFFDCYTNGRPGQTLSGKDRDAMEPEISPPAASWPRWHCPAT